MPVLRDRPLTSRPRNDGVGISMLCPKCGNEIKVNALFGERPLRCAACSYPLLKKSDFMPLITACEQVSTSDAQCVNLAAHILLKLSEMVPEAATALNRIVNRIPFTTISESERFNALSTAYAEGNVLAKEMLEKLCQSNPQVYEVQVCKNCGAKKYLMNRTAATKARCVYCQSED